MPRPDAHAQEYEHPVYENRGNGDQAHFMRDYGAQIRDYISRDAIRDSVRDVRDGGMRDSSREYSPHDFSTSTFYNSSQPSTYAGDRRPTLTSNLPAGPGFSSFVAPRMVNSPQAIGVGTGDSWSSKPAAFSAPPLPNRQSAEGGGGSIPSQVQPNISPLVLNHHHRPSPPRGISVAELYSPSLPPAGPYNDREVRDARELYLSRQLQQSSPLSIQLPPAQPPSLPSPNNITPSSRSTLWWGELEPWMDEEYAKQVCTLMGWDPVNIKVPRPAPDPITGQQANNPGYCFLTFPTQSHAASVLSQINNSNNGNGASVIMPNSTKPFSLNWASSVPSAPLTSTMTGQTISIPGVQNPQYPKEYSIFVGDLAPEVSNSDLVAVFRNPVLGLRNDREPRFIRPFLSCKSAKIMLDPVTGVSRGYGFVRFTDEADQQRALIEMHGLYCLSRPMRISPATAKFKPAPGMAGMDFSQMPFPPVTPGPGAMQEQPAQLTITLPLPSATQTKSVSAPLAGSTAASSSSASLNSATASNSGSSLSAPSLSSGSSTTLASASSEEALKAAQYGASNVSSNVTPSGSAGAPPSFPQPTEDQLMAQKFNMSEESWKHHAQARAILSNLIGPNGEQLTSSDPYNTTVFVGGLSPLISEDTLRTFFAPFGEIHYVKVPVGKHCGFVQFVRKPDAERAIEKMQGFPIGGSRIRLSWGRSQYKAAQAAAQAAQAAAFQAQYQAQVQAQTQAPVSLTPEQALQLLEKFGLTNLLNNPTPAAPENSIGERQIANALLNDVDGDRAATFSAFAPPIFGPRTGGSTSTFSPFSPDPNYLGEGAKSQDPSASQSIPQSAKGYAPWYNAASDDRTGNASGKASPSPVQMIRPSSGSQRFTSFLGETPSPYQPGRLTSRQDIPIGRPDATRKGSLHQEQYIAQQHEQDSIHDMNGTLASLDLDHQGMWRGEESVQSQTPAH